MNLTFWVPAHTAGRDGRIKVWGVHNSIGDNVRQTNSATIGRCLVGRKRLANNDGDGDGADDGGAARQPQQEGLTGRSTGSVGGVNRSSSGSISRVEVQRRTLYSAKAHQVCEQPTHAFAL